MTDEELLEHNCRLRARNALVVIERAMDVLDEAYEKDAFRPFAFKFAIDMCLDEAATAIIHALLSVDFEKIDERLDLNGVSGDSSLRRKIKELNEKRPFSKKIWMSESCND